MDNCLGIICARKDSKRFKNKNIKKISGLTLIERAYKTLLGAGLNDIVVYTDYELKDIPIVQSGHYAPRRPQDDGTQPLQYSVLQAIQWYAPKEPSDSNDGKYKWIIVLMPNCPGITSSDVFLAVQAANENNFNILRAYTHEGDENGLQVIDYEYYLTNYLDVYTGSMVTDGFEIHYEEDYEAMKEFIEKRELFIDS